MSRQKIYIIFCTLHMLLIYQICVMEINGEVTPPAIDEIRRTNEVVLSALKPGDLIKFDRDYYQDWAVYIGQEDGVEKVIHWSTENCTDFPTILAEYTDVLLKFYDFREEACIKISPFWEEARTSRSEKGNEKDRSDEKEGKINGSKVVEGAKTFKDRTEHEEISGLFDSSEHFAKWCRYGRLAHTPVDEITNLEDIWTFVRDPRDNNNKVDGKYSEHNTQLLLRLKEGDLIMFSRTFYHHWAVYIGKDDKLGEAVIHWCPQTSDLASKIGVSKMVINITSFWEAANGDRADKGNDNTLEKRHIDGRVVVIRAKVKKHLLEEGIVHENYHLWNNNCEYFAKWCRYGMNGSVLVHESSNRFTMDDLHIEDPKIKTAVKERFKKYETDILYLQEEVKQITTEIKRLQAYTTKVDKLEQENFYIKVCLSVAIATSVVTFFISCRR